jgi:hypothetical protein
MAGVATGAEADADAAAAGGEPAGAVATEPGVRGSSIELLVNSRHGWNSPIPATSDTRNAAEAQARRVRRRGFPMVQG